MYHSTDFVDRDKTHQIASKYYIIHAKITSAIHKFYNLSISIYLRVNCKLDDSISDPKVSR